MSRRSAMHKTHDRFLTFSEHQQQVVAKQIGRHACVMHEYDTEEYETNNQLQARTHRRRRTAPVKSGTGGIVLISETVCSNVLGWPTKWLPYAEPSLAVAPAVAGCSFRPLAKSKAGKVATSVWMCTDRLVMTDQFILREAVRRVANCQVRYRNVRAL